MCFLHNYHACQLNLPDYCIDPEQSVLEINHNEKENTPDIRMLSDTERSILFDVLGRFGAATPEHIHAHLNMNKKLCKEPISETELIQILVRLHERGYVEAHRIIMQQTYIIFLTLCPRFHEVASSSENRRLSLLPVDQKKPEQVASHLMAVSFISSFLARGLGKKMNYMAVGKCCVLDYANGKLVRPNGQLFFSNSSQILFEVCHPFEDWKEGFVNKLERYDCVFERIPNVILVLCGFSEQHIAEMKEIVRSHTKLATLFLHKDALRTGELVFRHYTGEFCQEFLLSD